MNDQLITYSDQNEYQIETSNLILINNKNNKAQKQNVVFNQTIDENKKKEGNKTKGKKIKLIKRKYWNPESLSIECYSFAYLIGNKNWDIVENIIDNHKPDSDYLNQSLVNEITQNKFDEVSVDELEKLKTNLVFEYDKNMLFDRNSNNENNNNEMNSAVIELKPMMKNKTKKQVNHGRQRKGDSLINNTPKKYNNHLTQSPTRDKKQNSNRDNKQSISQDNKQIIDMKDRHNKSKKNNQSFNKRNQNSNSKENNRNIISIDRKMKGNHNKVVSNTIKDIELKRPINNEEKNNASKTKKKQSIKYSLNKENKNTLNNQLKQRSKSSIKDDETANKLQKVQSKLYSRNKEKYYSNKDSIKASARYNNSLSDRDEIRSKSMNLLTPSYKNNNKKSNTICSYKKIEQLTPSNYTSNRDLIKIKSADNIKNDIRYHTIQEHPTKKKFIKNPIKFTNEKLQNKLKDNPITSNRKDKIQTQRDTKLIYNNSTKDLCNNKFQLNKINANKTRNRVRSSNQANTNKTKGKINRKAKNTSLSKYSGRKEDENETNNITNKHNGNKQQHSDQNNNNTVFLCHRKLKSNKLSNASTNISKLHPTPESSVKNHFGTKPLGNGKPYWISNYNKQIKNYTQPLNNIERNEEEALINCKIKKLNRVKSNRFNRRNKTPMQNNNNMSNTQDNKNQSTINQIKLLAKSNNTIDHFNQPFVNYQEYTSLRNMNNKIDKNTQSLSNDRKQAKNIFKKRISTKEEFSQTHMMNFYPQSNRLMSNITQKQFDEKMKYYKRLIKNPLNPYSAYYNKRFLMPQFAQIRYSNKAFSVLMPNLQDKTLIKNHTGLRSAKNINQIKTIYPNMTGNSFWNQSNRMSTIHNKNNNTKQTTEDMNKNSYLIK